MPRHRPKALSSPQARTFTQPTACLLLRARRALTLAVDLALLRLRQGSDAARPLVATPIPSGAIHPAQSF